MLLNQQPSPNPNTQNAKAFVRLNKQIKQSHMLYLVQLETT